SSFRAKPVVVLNALLSGSEVEMEGTRWVLDDRGELCSIATNQHGDEKLLRCDCTIGGFIAMCEKLDLTDTFLIGAVNVLRQGIR
ncbi:unnamed protein product, partial [marine sediment metagenome]